MIRKLSVQNFKSWKQTGELRLAPITGLFGGNSSGKTSLLQLLLMLKQTTESSDRAQVINLGDTGSLVELGTFSDVLFAHEKESSLAFQIEWDLPSISRISDPEHKGRFLFPDNA
jgi:AAA15 family ATPase/GTPase